MTRIAVISPGRARGDLAAAYRDVQGYMPRVGKLVQVCSLRPQWVRLMGEGMRFTLEAGTLSRAEKELLAVATSRAGACAY
ncbi:MAG TPA: hypothetical protein VI056_05380 [Candidatus Limnocylindria bacterium]